jgi:hypothetical protein
MPHSFLILLLILGLLSPSFGKNFVHPGARYGAYELNFVKTKIQQNEEPWVSHLQQAQNASSDSRALGLALHWYLTGDTTSAQQAIQELASYNNTTPYTPPPNRGGNQSSLEGAWVASVLAPAAEILSLYPGWSTQDKENTKNMFQTVFLPAMMTMSYWNGNVDLTQIDALLSIAVFLEDEAAWDEGIRRLSLRLPAYFYLSSDPALVRAYANGTYNWSASNDCAPLQWIDGLMQESCRDNGHHGQFAIAAALQALETAYLQGENLYEEHQERMTAAMELLALQLTTNNMQGACEGEVTNSRFNTLEVGYNHYHNRLNIELPNTWNAISTQLRNNGQQQFNMFHETLTNGDIEYGEGLAIHPTLTRKKLKTPTLYFHKNGYIAMQTYDTNTGKEFHYNLQGKVLYHQDGGGQLNTHK